MGPSVPALSPRNRRIVIHPALFSPSLRVQCGIIILLLVSGGSLPILGTECAEGEVAALSALYTATGGANWTNSTGWMKSSFCCSWFGITCGPSPVPSRGGPNVVGIDLENNGLHGTLPSWGRTMPRLVSLHLNKNARISGTLPASWGNLTALTDLNLGGVLRSRVSGSLPSELGRLTNLKTLFMFSSFLSGTLPPEWCAKTKLVRLHLYGNKLVGTLPSLWGGAAAGAMGAQGGLNVRRARGVINRSDTLGLRVQCEGLTSLRVMRLHYNALSGALPTAWSGLSSLETVSFYTNKLYGSLPPAWGNAMPSLASLHLNKNARISGTLPGSWGKMNALTDLNTSPSRVSGSLPSELGRLTNLKKLFMYSSFLSGTLPSEWGAMTKLVQVKLRQTVLYCGGNECKILN